MTMCKDCVHIELCNDVCMVSYDDNAEQCTYFKDVSKIVELPCKIGDYLEWDNGVGKSFYFQVIGFDIDVNGKVLRYITEEVIPEVLNKSIKRIVPKEEMEQMLKKENK